MKNKITPWDILNYSLQNIFFKGIEVDIAGVQKSEETIANFQWFLRRPSPLNVFGRSDHCHQWFYDGFLMLLPSLSMVFDGSGPLVKRCDGFDGSLWSSWDKKQRSFQCLLPHCLHIRGISRKRWANIFVNDWLNISLIDTLKNYKIIFQYWSINQYDICNGIQKKV